MNAFMWQTIARTLADRGIPPEQAMVVCGGFHLFLDRADPTPAPAIPQGTVSVTVVPYSYFRISGAVRLQGGKPSTRDIYQTCYEHHSAGMARTQW